MKKKTLNTEKKNKMNPMSDTRNYRAGSEGEDILDSEDGDIDDDEEPLPGEIAFPAEAEEDEEDDEDDEDLAPTLFRTF
jgi:hypothetical protein